MKKEILDEINRLLSELDQDKKLPSNKEVDEGVREVLEHLKEFVNSLPHWASYDTQKFTPTPSVDIEDVARVQFSSHAKVINGKRNAVLSWEQFKELAGIFYGFGNRRENGGWIDVKDSLPPMDEEVIVLRSEFPGAFYKISFGHIVDRRYCVDYDGWNVPYVRYWMPCPEIPGQDE